MQVTKDMTNEIIEQVISSGVAETNGTYVFHGKRENVVLRGKVLQVHDAEGSDPVQGARNARNVMKMLDASVANDEFPFYEMIHMILRANGQRGFSESSNPLIPRINEIIDRNDYGF